MVVADPNGTSRNQAYTRTMFLPAISPVNIDSRVLRALLPDLECKMNSLDRS